MATANIQKTRQEVDAAIANYRLEAAPYMAHLENIVNSCRSYVMKEGKLSLVVESSPEYIGIMTHLNYLYEKYRNDITPVDIEQNVTNVLPEFIKPM